MKELDSKCYLEHNKDPLNLGKYGIMKSIDIDRAVSLAKLDAHHLQYHK